MKKKLIIVIIIITILILIISIYWVSNRKLNEKWLIYYEINISTNSTDPYFIYLPVPIASRVDSSIKDQPIKLMDELQFIEGDGKFSIISTKYGYALNLSGIGNIRLIGKWDVENPSTKEESYYLFNDVSMETEGNGKEHHFFYFNSSNNNTYLDFSCIEKNENEIGSSHYELGINNYNLKKGWQDIDIYIKDIIVN